MERQESERTRRNRFIQSMITFIMKFVCKTRRTSGTIEELKNILLKRKMNHYFKKVYGYPYTKYNAINEIIEEHKYNKKKTNRKC